MRVSLLFFLVLPAWWLPVGYAAAAEFVLTPLLCVQQKSHSCAVTLKVRWQQASPSCLYLLDQPDTPLLCGPALFSQELPLQLHKNSQFVLRPVNSPTVLAQRQVKVLTIDLNAGDQLLKRSRWGM
ncbi:MAG: DUF3019 domain-containing protein [Rheinheimera sp.]|nr:DUF3019 domain-containing protein [Rheinheimera sp.]